MVLAFLDNNAIVDMAALMRISADSQHGVVLT